jgi:hypothetical protein
MSDDNAHGSGPEDGDGIKRKEFKIVVDGRQLESADSHLTGLQIKTLAGANTTFGLYLEGRGHDSDRPIGDGEIVDLKSHGKDRFYTAPPATYGSGARRVCQSRMTAD